MEKIKLRYKAEASKIETVTALRKWQQNSISRRCPLKKLADKLNTTESVLRQMLTSGVKKVKVRSMHKKAVLREAKKKLRFTKTRRFPKSKLKTSALMSVIDEPPKISLRTANRLVGPLRRETADKRREYWKKWHLAHPNRGISDAEWLSMSRRGYA